MNIQFPNKFQRTIILPARKLSPSLLKIISRYLIDFFLPKRSILIQKKIGKRHLRNFFGGTDDFYKNKRQMYLELIFFKFSNNNYNTFLSVIFLFSHRRL